MTVTASTLLADLRAHTNVLLYGPPASGKTYLMQQVAQEFVAGGDAGSAETLAIDTEDEEDPLLMAPAKPPMVRWVTFHQSYSYEDFVLGLRPDPKRSGPLQLRPVPGVLLELAAHAASGGESLLLIDELNRGNTSRIFGEFITLLEPDKRLREDGSPTPLTVQTKLPYVGEQDTLKVRTESGEVELPTQFALPRGLYTLATMNSVDKSVAPLDVALRRRFHMIQLRGDDETLIRAAGLEEREPESGSVDDIRLLAVRLIRHLNDGIALYLGQDVELGPWYLASLAHAESGPVARAQLRRLWWHLVLPQLEELFQGQPDQLIELLALDATTPVRVITPSAGRQRLGALPYLVRAEVDEPSTISYLRKLVAVDRPTEEGGEVGSATATEADADVASQI